MSFDEFKKETVARIADSTGLSVLQELLFSYGPPNRNQAIREYIQALEDELRRLLDAEGPEGQDGPLHPMASLLLRVAELEKNFRELRVELDLMQELSRPPEER
jgi:hypothetical protein